MVAERLDEECLLGRCVCCLLGNLKSKRAAFDTC
jgi:hypothetical protein